MQQVKQAGSGRALALIRDFYGIERVYEAFDQVAQGLEAVRAAPICVENCGRCCEINTPFCWDIEASHIISDLLGKGKLALALDACESWMRDRQPGLTVYGPNADSASPEGRTKILQETQVAARRPCPFLNADKRCEIHDVRPLVCRTYGVTRLPSQDECRAPLGRGESHERRAHHNGAGLKQQVESYLYSLRADQRVSYFLPWALMRQGRREKAAQLEEGFATAKMVAFPQSPALLWQSQLNALWGR